MTKSGMTQMPSTARIQFFWNIITRATTSVIEFDRMFRNVFVITDSTPEMSLVIRVMISPWLFVVKNRCDIRCRCENIWLRIS